MSTVDISTLKTTDEWEAAITRAFQRATHEAVLENARLGLSNGKSAVDLLGPALREANDAYRAVVPKVADDEPTTDKADE